MSIHKTNLGPSSYLGRAARLTILQLENEQHHIGLVEQCHDDSFHTAKGGTDYNHALGGLEGEKCESFPTPGV